MKHHPFPISGGTYRWDGKALVREDDEPATPEPATPETGHNPIPFRRRKQADIQDTTED